MSSMRRYKVFLFILDNLPGRGFPDMIRIANVKQGSTDKVMKLIPAHSVLPHYRTTT